MNDPAATAAVLVVDDHEMVATSLEWALTREGLNAVRVPVRDVESILAAARAHVPGVALLDLELGWDDKRRPMSGVSLVQPLVKSGWQVILLSGSSDAARLGAALHEGALAWLPKRAPLPHLVAAIGAAFAGRPVMPPEKRDELIDAYRRQADAGEEMAAKLGSLSNREREVLADLAQGMRAQAIADKYVVSLATIRTQIRGILKKLGVTSQLQAVVLYRSWRRP